MRRPITLLVTFLAGVAILHSQTWRSLSPTGTPPQARSQARAVLDTGTNQMIVYGGTANATDLGDTSALTLSSPQWTALSPAGTLPAARADEGAAYDTANARMIIFGGALGNASPCANDTWVLSNANRQAGTPTWTQLSTTGGPPAVRHGQSALYDSASNRMIIFGGNNCFNTDYNDVWILTNANGMGGTPVWSQLTTTGAPPVRYEHSAVYDSTSNRMIIFGGGSPSGLLGDTWVLSNANGLSGSSTWTQLSPIGAQIPVRGGHSAGYQPSSNRMIVALGGGNSGDLNDVWVLSNANGVTGTPAWTQLTISGVSPPARSGQTTVYNPNSDIMTIFSGTTPTLQNDTWVLTGAATPPQPPTVTTTSLPNGVVGISYSAQLNASGGSTPYVTWSATGTTPSGLTLNSSTGLISGMPSSAGSSSFTVTVKDSAGNTSSGQALSIIVTPALSITTVSPLTGGAVGTAYSTSLSASSGVAPYVWTLASGILPPGLTLSSSGGINGNTTAAGNYIFTAKVTDSGSPAQTATKTFSLAIVSALSLSCNSPGPATVNAAYSLACTASGGTTPYNYTLSAGTLPPGLNLTPSGGSLTVSGTPSTAGSYTFTLKALDSGNPNPQSVLQTVTVTVNPPVTTFTLNCPAPGTATANSAFSLTCAAAGGTPPYTSTVSSGTLPPGLNLTASGGSLTVSGTASTAGSYTFTLKALDSGNPNPQSALQTVTVTVNPPTTTLTLNCPTPGAGTVNSAFNLTCTAAGGTTPYNYTLNSGTLPPGLNLTSSGGTLTVSGTPSTAGSYTFILKALDSGSPNPQSALQTVTVTVNPPVTTLTLNCPTPGTATANSAFSLTCTATGGTPPYTSTVSSGTVPPGLNLTPSGGTLTINGTPSTAGSYTFTLKALDSGSPNPQSALQTVTVTVSPAVTTLTLNCPAPGTAIVNSAFSLTCTAAGGTPPYTSAVSSGTLPPGLALSASGNSLAINGTPSTAGSYTFTLKAVDSGSPNSQSTTQTVTITVNPAASPLTLNCPVPAAATVSSAFTLTCSAVGGTIPYFYALSAGALPPGLSLAPAGNSAVISGVPNTAGTYTLTIKATDSGNPTPQTASQTVTITVNPPAKTLTLNCPPPGPATLNSQFSLTCAISGGTTPYYVTTVSGALPPGLNSAIAGSSLTITGTPTAAGQFSVNLTIFDSQTPTAQSANQTIPIVVAAGVPLTFTCPQPGPATANAPFSLVCTAAGGTTPYQYSISTGSAPPGLTVTGSGSTVTLSGTPTTPGQYGLTLKVVDSSVPAPQSATQSVAITVISSAPTLTLVCPQPDASATNTSFTLGCTISGGTAPYSASIVSGTLPSGLSIAVSKATVTVSGVPTAAGQYNFAVKVTDSSAPVQSASVSSLIVVTAHVPNLVISPALLSFSFFTDAAGQVPSQTLSVLSNAPASFSATVSTTSGGNWLSVNPASGQTPANLSISVSPEGLSPGAYTGQVSVTQSGGNTATNAVVTLTVTAPQPPAMRVSPPGTTFSTAQGTPSFQQSLLVANTGGGTLSFVATAANSSVNWLSIQTGSGTAINTLPGSVSYIVNPANLSPGIYFGSITVTAASVNQIVVVPVNLNVSAQPQSIVLSQTGIPFTSITGGPALPSQVFAVLNSGQGSMNWTATTATLSGGNGWLNISPTSGVSVAGSATPPLITISVNQNQSGLNQQALAPGTYYGSVNISAPGAANSPQKLLVQFTVLPSGQSSTPLVSTAGAVFATSGNQDPSPQTLILSNPDSQPTSFTSIRSTDDGNDWFIQNPTSGSVAPGVPLQIQLQAKLSGLTPGVRHGVLTVAFSDGTVHSVGIYSIVTASSSISNSKAHIHADAVSGCPSKLVVQSTTLEPNFQVSVGQKVPIGVLVYDDCGHAINSAAQSTVTMTPVGGGGLRLVPQGNGLWTGTWQPLNTSSSTAIALDATAIAPGTAIPVAGSAQLSGAVTRDTSTEAISTGIFNAASYVQGNQVAVGSFVSLFGVQMADSPAAVASGVPLPTQLGNTQVLLGNLPLRLSYAGPSQVNALIPAGVPTNAEQQLIVQHGQTQSLAVPVTVADSQPGIYTANQQGTGQGAILIAGDNVVAAPMGTANGARPAVHGDYLEIFATGLGAVTNAPSDGAPAPSSPPLATSIASPQVMIGGVAAAVSYSGLAPGFVGLYQVNVQVPDSAPIGVSVPVVITIGSAVSNTATMAIQ